MDKFKYPSTPHLPGSGSKTRDDSDVSRVTLANLRSGRELIVTEKMDGGNVSLYRDDFHARSLDAHSQPWDSAAKAKWAQIRYMIPEGVRLSGESIHARRSVAYDNLAGPLLVFGAWSDRRLMDWGETVSLAATLELPTVPLLYRGHDFDEALNAWTLAGLTAENSEGFVVREAGSFSADEFADHIAKWVRFNHVQTSDDWRRRDDFEVNGYA